MRFSWRPSPTALLAISLLLIVLAAMTLIIGWGTADSRFTGASVVASAGAALCLPIAWYESRRLAKRGLPPEELRGNRD